MLMFSGLVGDGVHENIFWPDLPYVTDEHGNVYFQVKNDEDILQTLTSEDTLVTTPLLFESDDMGSHNAIISPAIEYNKFEVEQVIIGLDTTEMVSEMELIGQAESDYDMEEEDEDSGTDDDDKDADDDDEDDESGDYENEWVSLLEDEEDGEDSDESLGDWAKLETMRSSHPMHFAKQLAQPPAGLALQGVLRPAFVEESSVINKYVLDGESNDEEAANQVSEGDEEDLGVINGHEPESSQDVSSEEDESQKDQISGNRTSYYKL
ncbi:hypothetical protein Tco_1359133 [Tanacetum coccineum]